MQSRTERLLPGNAGMHRVGRARFGLAKAVISVVSGAGLGLSREDYRARLAGAAATLQPGVTLRELIELRRGALRGRGARRSASPPRR